jgi:hypothetical protein
MQLNWLLLLVIGYRVKYKEVADVILLFWGCMPQLTIKVTLWRN